MNDIQITKSHIGKKPFKVQDKLMEFNVIEYKS